MANTFYFYDLETSGVSPRRDRVMQFAGQRTDMELKPVAEPDNILIKLTPDVLPQPEAILITGITPQQTLADGITEAEFLKYFMERVVKSDTIIVGFNNVRFDDEFIRFMLWRNFYDAYEWQWKNGCSRWDLLDLVRMTRALRPEGIKWPFAPDGKPSNRLQLLSDLNGLEHVNAHDALSDVVAAIDVARLIKKKQPKLFDYLLNIRAKSKASALVNRGLPFLYTSGRYPGEFLKTAVAVKVADHPSRPGALVYDLRIDPKEFVSLEPKNLAELWSLRGEEAPYFPVKAIMYNRCPALAPLNVLDNDSQKRLQVDLKQINNNLKLLKTSPQFAQNLAEAQKIIEASYQQQLVPDPALADEQLYDGFVADVDKPKVQAIREASAKELAALSLTFEDQRLNGLLPLYKARNYPKTLSQEEQQLWEKYRLQKLTNGGGNSQLSRYFRRLNELADRPGISDAERYVLEELNLYGQSLSPVDA